MSSSKVIQHQICPDGWRRYGETCFYVEMERLPFDMAEARCKDKNSTIFVADSLDEWELANTAVLSGSEWMDNYHKLRRLSEHGFAAF
ncbi:hypothetical protein ANCCEY_09364 [Ancylostoma ceylanicum]|uniref:C-type lectin domain-containing protein n=1 Tax=Ancylostoma ceylanicum TaxID=53326 RepID=A0A0D6LV73_9BILA|nr:hypothetical protein ANCCEY_09364 [Ancylostoma ceylanicum]